MPKESIIKNFYNKEYKNLDKHKEDPFLYRKLKKFELNRVDACLKAINTYLRGNHQNIESILEIGFGEGFFLEKLIQTSDSISKIFGLEVAVVRIDRCEERLLSIYPNLNLSLREFDCNYTPWPIPSDEVNLVVAISVLEHLFDPFSFINEAKRVLGPDGLLVIQVPNIAFIHNRIRLVFGRLPVTSSANGWDGGHLHYFTKNSLIKAFKNLGFKHIFTSNSGIFSNVRSIWKSFLAGDLILGFKL